MQARETYTYGKGRASYYNHQTGDTYQYLTNQSGSVTGLTKEGQAVVSTSYHLYGSTQSTTDQTGNPFAYNGEARDITGLDYLRARYYDHQVGTFLTADSYQGDDRDPLSQNLYSYVQNNPVNYTDPSGHRAMGLLGGGGRRRKPKPTKVYPIFSSDTPVVTRVAIINNQPLAKSIQNQQIHAVRTGQPGIWNPTRPAYGYAQRAYQPNIPTSQSYQQQSVYQPVRTVLTVLEQAQANGQSTYNWSKSKSKEAANIHRNWTKALEETQKHICDPKRMKGKDSGQNKKPKISVGQFREIEAASRHGLTVEQKKRIDKLTLGELTRQYPFLHNVTPYQGYSASNAKERDYIIARYYELLQKSAPKPPSILDDPNYAYYSAIARTGIDPRTGKKVSPAEIAHAQLQQKILIAAPIVQSIAAGYAFSQQQNVGGKPKKPSSGNQQKNARGKGPKPPSGNHTNKNLANSPVQQPKPMKPGSPYQGLSDQNIADGFVKGLDDITKSGSLAKNYQASDGYEQAL